MHCDTVTGMLKLKLVYINKTGLSYEFFADFKRRFRRKKY